MVPIEDVALYDHVVLVGKRMTRKYAQVTWAENKSTFFDISSDAHVNLTGLKKLMAELPKKTLMLFIVDQSVLCDRDGHISECFTSSCSKTAVPVYKFVTANAETAVSNALKVFLNCISQLKAVIGSDAGIALLPLVPSYFISSAKISDHALLHETLEHRSDLIVIRSPNDEAQNSLDIIIKEMDNFDGKIQLPDTIATIITKHRSSSPSKILLSDSLRNFSNSKSEFRGWNDMFHHLLRLSLGQNAGRFLVCIYIHYCGIWGTFDFFYLQVANIQYFIVTEISKKKVV